MISCISLKTGKPVPIPAQTVLALGSFDGVHLAHQALLNATLEWGRTQYKNAQVGVFCFRDLPSETLSGVSVGRLCSLEERLERFAACGMQLAILADFSDLRHLSASDYARSFLMEQCNCVAVACGYNHRFGKGGVGAPDLLNALFEGRVLICEPKLYAREPISSTRIRALISEGDVEAAAKLLGRPYTLTAPVMHGKALGRKMGIPTLNQNFPDFAVLPRGGVYATSCRIDGHRYYGVSNVGVHPTVDAHAPLNCETYLLDFNGDLYDRELKVSFLRFIREETRFSSVAELTDQIQADIQAVRQEIEKDSHF